MNENMSPLRFEVNKLELWKNLKNLLVFIMFQLAESSHLL